MQKTGKHDFIRDAQDRRVENATPWYKDTDNYGGVNGAYDYTEKMEKVKELEPGEINEFLCLSEEEIAQMSTESLLLTSIDYPYIGDIYVFDSFQKGYSKVKGANNVLQKMLERNDACETLVNFYKSIDLEKVENTDNLSATRMTFIHLMLADDQVVLNLTERERKELIYACLDNIVLIDQKYSNSYNINVLASLTMKLIYYDNEEFRRLVDTDESLVKYMNQESVTISAGTDIYLYPQVGNIIERDYLKKR